MGRKRGLEKILQSEFVSISEVLQLSSIRYSTIKYYTEEEIMPLNSKIKDS